MSDRQGGRAAARGGHSGAPSRRGGRPGGQGDQRDGRQAAAAGGPPDARAGDAEISREQARRLADEHEATLLRREEGRAELETWLSLADNGDGTFSGRFVIPELHGHLLRAALEQLTSPAQLSRNRAGEVVHDEAVANRPGQSGTEKLGLGFTELIEHLPTSSDGLAGGFTRNALTLLVHLDHRHLLDGLASARLDTGVHLSAGETRRLACNAGLLPSARWRLAGPRPRPHRRLHSRPAPSPLGHPRQPVPPRAANDPSRGATSTIPTHGARAAAPTSPTHSRCAASTTAAPTTPASTSDGSPPARSASVRAGDGGRRGEPASTSARCSIYRGADARRSAAGSAACPRRCPGSWSPGPTSPRGRARCSRCCRPARRTSA